MFNTKFIELTFYELNQVQTKVVPSVNVIEKDVKRKVRVRIKDIVAFGSETMNPDFEQYKFEAQRIFFKSAPSAFVEESWEEICDLVDSNE